MEDKKLEEKVKEIRKADEIRIDPSVPWYEEHNRYAAKELGVKYDKKSKVYKDSDGCPVLDKFGQPLG